MILFTEYLTDSDSDDAESMFTSQATQGYSEGLADNELESEVSSIFGGENSIQIPDLPKNGQDLGGGGSAGVNPLEYSAMLKLYGAGAAGNDPRMRQNVNKQRHLKDSTPDSGVVADGSNSNSNKSTNSSAGSNDKPKQNHVSRLIKPKPTENSSQNSLISR